MNLHELEDTAMVMKIALIGFLLVGFCAYAAPAWASEGNPVLPPQEVVAKSASWIAPEAGSSWRSGISRSLPQIRANSTGSPRAREFGSGFSCRTVGN
jgi:hypothetical protein